MVTYGRCYNQEEGGAASGPTALACYAVLLEDESGGCGTLKIMCGQRCTRSIKGDGFMSTRARKLGIIPGCTRKVSTIPSRVSPTQG